MTDEHVTIEHKGFSTLALFFIPAALGIAAIIWFGFYVNAHYFKREMEQEKRHAEIVGAAVIPNKPIETKINNRRNATVIIDRLEIDGSEGWIYYKNIGRSKASFIEITVNAMAPDGTIVGVVQGYADGPFHGAIDLGPDQRAEGRFTIPTDPRTSVLEAEIEWDNFDELK